MNVPVHRHHLVTDAVFQHLKGAERPLTTSELSRLVTADMRRLVSDGAAAAHQVMNYNPTFDHWEVTGAVIRRVIDRHPRIVQYGEHGPAKVWATAENVAAWEAAARRRDDAAAAAKARYRVERNPVEGWVRVVDADRPGLPHGVATFDTDTDLTVDAAIKLADLTVRRLVVAAAVRAAS